MNRKILLTITTFILVLPILMAQLQPQIYYKTDLIYENGQITIQKMEPNFYGEKPFEESGDYKIEILDLNNKVIDTITFNISTLAIVEYVDESGEIVGGEQIELEQVEITLYIPYYSKAKEFIIYNKNNKILATKSLEEYTKTSENTFDEIPDSYKSDPQNGLGKSNTLMYLIILIIVFLFLIIIYIIKRKRR